LGVNNIDTKNIKRSTLLERENAFQNLSKIIKNLDEDTKFIIREQKLMKRRDSILDINTKFYQDTPVKRSAIKNKDLFLKSYGVNYEIPSMYILDSCIFSKDNRYIIQFVKYVIPKNKILNI